jgi:hypothetical protein
MEHTTNKIYSSSHSSTVLASTDIVAPLSTCLAHISAFGSRGFKVHDGVDPVPGPAPRPTLVVGRKQAILFQVIHEHRFNGRNVGSRNMAAMKNWVNICSRLQSPFSNCCKGVPARDASLLVPIASTGPEHDVHFPFATRFPHNTKVVVAPQILQISLIFRELGQFCIDLLLAVR